MKRNKIKLLLFRANIYLKIYLDLSKILIIYLDKSHGFTDIMVKCQYDNEDHQKVFGNKVLKFGTKKSCGRKVLIIKSIWKLSRYIL